MNMSKSGSALIALAALALNAAPMARAQETHEHKAPHGGLVTEVGQDRHLELDANDGQILVYVLDHNVAPLPVAGMTASADILIKGRERFTVPLTISGDHFVGALALNPAGRTTLIITVKSEGKSMIGRFVWAPAAEPLPAGNLAPAPASTP